MKQPQWSPVTWTGKRRSSRGCGRRAWTRRNGARSRGPGRAMHENQVTIHLRRAAMEPGHVDREETHPPRHTRWHVAWPQWSPVTWTGKSADPYSSRYGTFTAPQWSPVTWTGKSSSPSSAPSSALRSRNGARSRGPGRGPERAGPSPPAQPAAMEPGHVDREEPEDLAGDVGQAEPAAMEPGHVDREESGGLRARRGRSRRNGARSRGPGRGLALEATRDLRRYSATRAVSWLAGDTGAFDGDVGRKPWPDLRSSADAEGPGHWSARTHTIWSPRLGSP